MLAAGKHGAIVNIASVLGFGVAKGTIAYAVAKAGVIQITKALALELAFKGIRVNAIAPGWIVTDLNRDYLTERARVLRSSARFRSAASARSAISTARCCCSSPTPAASSRAPPSWSTAASWWRCGDEIGQRAARTCLKHSRRMRMDFTLSPEIEDVRLRTRRFVEEHVLPLETDPANYDEHENIRLDVLRGRAGEGQGRGAVGAAGAEGIRRHGAADRRLGRDVRGSESLDLRSARVQLRGARRRQHEPARAGRHGRAEGQMAAAHRRRQGALLLRHDRARARRRLRSRHDPHARGEEGRQLG